MDPHQIGRRPLPPRGGRHEQPRLQRSVVQLRSRRRDELLDMLGVSHIRKNRGYELSGGERRRVEICRALATSPRFVLLDEPFAGIDPIAVQDIQGIVRSLTDRGLGVLITDHNVQRTLEICDRAYVLLEGRVQAEGKPRDLINDEMVKKYYLGSTFRGDEFD